MKRNHSRSGLIELGKARRETRGSQGPKLDVTATQPASGISDD